MAARDCPKLFGYPNNSGTGKATDFSFGRYIHTGHPNKSPLKFWRQGSVGISSDWPTFWVPPIISGTGNSTDFKICKHIYRVDRTKVHEKYWEKLPYIQCYYAVLSGLHFFIELSATLTKLCHRLLSATNIICSKCPPSVETHTEWSHLIWHNFAAVGDENLYYIAYMDI